MTSLPKKLRKHSLFFHEFRLSLIRARSRIVYDVVSLPLDKYSRSKTWLVNKDYFELMTSRTWNKSFHLCVVSRPSKRRGSWLFVFEQYSEKVKLLVVR